MSLSPFHARDSLGRITAKPDIEQPLTPQKKCQCFLFGFHLGWVICTTQKNHYARSEREAQNCDWTSGLLSFSSLVPSHQLRLGQDVTLHRLLYIPFCGSMS